MSIVRIGLGETRGFGEGYDAIFSKKKATAAKKPTKARVKASVRKTAKKKK